MIIKRDDFMSFMWINEDTCQRKNISRILALAIEIGCKSKKSMNIRRGIRERWCFIAYLENVVLESLIEFFHIAQNSYHCVYYVICFSYPLSTSSNSNYRNS